MKQHGPWQIIEHSEVYRDPWLRVTCDNVIRPDGEPGTHSVVEIKPGVSVLAVDERQHVFLTEEFHYAVGRTTTETVSGGIEPGEQPQESAARELQEEIGLTARRWDHVATVDPLTASVTSPTQLFIARDLQQVETNPEGTELIRRLRVPLAEAVKMVLDGRITHAPSCVLILLAERSLAR